MRSAISRVTTSVLPPGLNGTTIVTGRDGKAGCDQAGRSARDGAAERPASDAAKSRREASGMVLLPVRRR